MQRFASTSVHICSRVCLLSHPAHELRGTPSSSRFPDHMLWVPRRYLHCRALVNTLFGSRVFPGCLKYWQEPSHSHLRNGLCWHTVSLPFVVRVCFSRVQQRLFLLPVHFSSCRQFLRWRHHAVHCHGWRAPQASPCPWASLVPSGDRRVGPWLCERSVLWSRSYVSSYVSYLRAHCDIMAGLWLYIHISDSCHVT